MALIPTSPPLPPRLPVSGTPTPSFSPADFALGLFNTGIGIGRTIRAANAAGLRGAARQAPIVRTAVLGLATSLPGLNLLGLFAGLAKLAIGETLPAFIRGEISAGSDRGLSQPIPATSPLANRPGQIVNVGATTFRVPPGGIPHDPTPVVLPPILQELQREFILNRARLVDPRTGGGIAPGVLAREASPLRIAEVRAAERQQQIRFAGVPSIFVRRRL